MPSLRYVGPRPVAKKGASATDQGKRARCKPEPRPSIKVLKDNSLAAPKLNDDIVNRVGRLSIDPSKQMGSIRTTDVNRSNKEDFVEKENIGKTTIALLRSPTQSPYAKASKHYNRQKASMARNDPLKSAYPTVTDTSNLVNKAESARTNANHPKCLVPPMTLAYNSGGLPFTYPYDEMQPNLVHSDHRPSGLLSKGNTPSISHDVLEAPTADDAQCVDTYDLFQPSHAAANACAQFYLGHPLQKKDVETPFLSEQKLKSDATVVTNQITHKNTFPKMYMSKNSYPSNRDKELPTKDSIMPKVEATDTLKAIESVGTKQKKNKDPNAPKHPKTGYIFFQSDMRPKIKNEFPNISFGEVGKVLGQMWRNLSPEEKKKYNVMAMEDRSRYHSELTSYWAKLKVEKSGLDSTSP